MSRAPPTSGILLGGGAYVHAVTAGVLVNLVTAEQGHGGGEWDGAGLAVAPRVVLARWGLRFVWKVGALATSLFLMVCTGALVAFALAEGQARLVQLSGELRWVLRSRLPYTGVVLRYALDGLVFVPIVTGILFFLFEFFDDQLLAFCVLAVAWLCEVTVAVSNRHWVSRHYLPRLLFTYFLAFHMYFFSYPLGYAWLSLATCVAFMAHAVIALWNRWELPLLVTRQWQQHLRAQRQ